MAEDKFNMLKNKLYAFPVVITMQLLSHIRKG